MEEQRTEEQLNLYQKLAKIRQIVEIMKKDKKAFGYNYTKEESILAKVTACMKKYDLSLIPGIVPGTTKVEPFCYKKTKVTQKGDIYEENVNEVLVSADTTWTWVDNNSPSERITVPWAMVGQQSDASQSFGSGLTYSSRYFLLKYFNIATSDDDPDNYRSKQREAEAEEDKLVAGEIVKKIDELVHKVLAESPEKRDEVLKLVQKYVKSGDYNKISESLVAKTLLDEIKNKFAKETT